MLIGAVNRASRWQKGLADRIGSQIIASKSSGQTSGNKFEDNCANFLQNTFLNLSHLRPGDWKVEKVGGRNRLKISEYEQYSHLAALAELAKKDRNLAAALGNDYAITPDVVISRRPETDSAINMQGLLVDSEISKHSSIRSINNSLPTLHASVSCKWTIRSDRVQNARSEALNLVRNRKGRLPHIVVITAEPTPNRLSAIALGTGDIDCTYHFALTELQETVADLRYAEAAELLEMMVEGKRLKDISDLPLDLAV